MVEHFFRIYCLFGRLGEKRCSDGLFNCPLGVPQFSANVFHLYEERISPYRKVVFSFGKGDFLLWEMWFSPLGKGGSL